MLKCLGHIVKTAQIIMLTYQIRTLFRPPSNGETDFGESPLLGFLAAGAQYWARLHIVSRGVLPNAAV